MSRRQLGSHAPTPNRTTRPLPADARPRAAIVALVIMLLTGMVAAPPATAQQGSDCCGTQEQRFIELINDLRARRGLATLAVDAELTRESRHWAGVQGDRGDIFHAPDLSVGLTADWQRLGENVGVGSDIDGLFRAFVDSPAHYANLVDPTFRFVGVGVVKRGERFYTTHRFMSLRPPPPPPPPAPPPPPTVAPPAAPAEPPATAPPAAEPPATAPPTTAPTTTEPTQPAVVAMVDAPAPPPASRAPERMRRTLGTLRAISSR